MQAQGIRSIKKLGIQNCLDFEVEHKDHNFYADGIIVSNSHSTTYGYLTAITAQLKSNHPKEFFLSLLNNAQHEQSPLEEITLIFSELSKFGIKLLPPDLFKSDTNFTIEGENIRYGISAIKGISEKTLEKVISFRGQFLNKFQAFQAAKDAKLPISVMSSLIQVGALSSFGESRSKLVLEAQLWNILTVTEKKYCLSLADENNFDLIKIIKKLVEEVKNAKGRIVIPASRFETIKKKYLPHKQIYLQNNKNEDFASWYYEKTLTGCVFSKSLISIFSEKVKDLISLNEVRKLGENGGVLFVGIVESCYSARSQKDQTKRYYKLKIIDETDSTNLIIYGDKKIEACQGINKRMPAKDDVVIVRGKKGKEIVFADIVSVQENKVYIKSSEIED